MRDLRVTLVQADLHWEDPEANRAAFERRLGPLGGHTDLIVLPEMFTTGFTMRSRELSEPEAGPTREWMGKMAAALGAALYGSVIVEAGGRCFNRGLFVTPQGEVTTYDKRHLFRMAREDRYYAPGRARVVVEWREWRLLLQVCYDLRFPVFSRNRGDYDALLYVANWPAARRMAWNRLLPARAIENLAYCVGVNRVGTDGEGIGYAGDSSAFDFRGDPIPGIGETDPGAEGVRTARLEGQALTEFRAGFPAHLDADAFELGP